ncbi:MAG: outer membrane protein transport protein [Tannerellaceae bacterium]
MKKIACLFAVAFLLSGTAAFAQGEMDAYKFSQTELNGTARYLSMGGAFGALGGDISSMTSNPAGLGVYRSSEVVTTISLSGINTSSNLNGSSMSESKTKFSFDNIAYVGYFPTGNDTGIKGWNIGIAYNRTKNFNRNYTVSGSQGASLANYVADKSYGIHVDDLTLVKDKYDPYNNTDLGGNWLSILGFEGGYFETYPDATSDYHSALGEWVNNKWVDSSPKSSRLNVNEKGSVDKYDFSFATNISDLVFLGATFAVTDLNYSYLSKYDEDFGGKDRLYLDNGLTTDGTGYSFNIGAIVRPVEFLRVGVAYNSPTWYKMTDYYHAEAGTYITGLTPPGLDAVTPDYQYSESQLRTPDKWIFSAAAILGQSALLSVDYELSNYKSMRLYDNNGNAFIYENDYIKTDFGLERMLKVGAEVKVTPQFAVRAGGAWQTSSVKSHLKDGSMEVFTAGTIPNYTVDKGSSYYSVGLGYRFTPNFYADLTCIYREQKENVFAFSNTYLDDHSVMVKSDPATMKTKSTRVALTLGYKF